MEKTSALQAYLGYLAKTAEPKTKKKKLSPVENARLLMERGGKTPLLPTPLSELLPDVYGNK